MIMKGRTSVRRGVWILGAALFLFGIHVQTFAEGGSESELYYARGLTHGEEGKFGRAIVDYTKALEINPDHKSAYYNRGFAYAMNGNLDQAISDYTKAIDLNPK